MSTLSTLIMQAREGLCIQQKIPQEKWEEIASQCGPAEIAEIKERIAALKAELGTIEEWDGETMDDINIAIYRFSLLLELSVGAP
ncbi:hypothetical protein [Pseudomonas sp. GR 6-02]|uniref:hypothetical protein n=1 Tax=Pseudomonas sp. GR 6-02 TaxID=1659194 RepID=UPI0007DD2093|nr:hypothetical protein [Pseudomonas sp. GR 6-02]ANI60930.1 hypothetical protein PGR6_33570 [Pseudomonas sp. GR 6-02]